MRIAIVGAGIAGLAAAWELARLAQSGVPVEAVLFESSSRTGGLIETVREGGFTVEAGPDAWLTAKPAASALAVELGLEGEIIPSNDAARRTWVLLRDAGQPDRLVPMPDGMNLMVPTALESLAASPLIPAAALAAYRAEPARAAELLASVPRADESVAAFTLRHFGPDVLARVAAPLLGGILGGDVHTLSARATLPALVALERSHGSLISALSRRRLPSPENPQPATALFTTLRSGLGTLADRLTASLPPQCLRLNTAVTALAYRPPPETGNPNHETLRPGFPRWTLTSTSNSRQRTETFDAVFLATPTGAARDILTPLLPSAAHLLPVESSSAVLVAFCFPDARRVPLPPGFGFLVPPAQTAQSGAAHSASAMPAPTHPALLACTFADQKFPCRVPPNGRLLRAFFGGAAADRLARCNNDEIAAIARAELGRILNLNAPLTGPLPAPLPAPVLTVVRRWPRSLPQYAVGHLERAAELESRLRALPGVTLLGNALHGVGIPDLIQQARDAARSASGGLRTAGA